MQATCNRCLSAFRQLQLLLPVSLWLFDGPAVSFLLRMGLREAILCSTRSSQMLQQAANANENLLNTHNNIY